LPQAGGIAGQSTQNKHRRSGLSDWPEI
jgi:hypothetical protein